MLDWFVLKRTTKKGCRKHDSLFSVSYYSIYKYIHTTDCLTTLEVVSDATRRMYLS